MIKVAVAGVAGQMGRTLVKLISEASDLELAAGYEGPEHPRLGEDCGFVAGIGESGVPVEDVQAFVSGAKSSGEAKNADILLDFSVPDMTVELSTAGAQAKMGLVIGTTGQTADDLQQLVEVANEVPLLMSPNMSVGVNIAFKLIEMATRAVGEDADVEIYEIHHKLKIDSPSGTAVRMGEIVASERNRRLEDVAEYGREGNTGRRIAGAIGFHSARGGDVVGEHTVTFAGDGERIEVTHRAHSRVNFAAGALRATRFIYDRLQGGEVGSFDMNQVLGLG